MSAQPQPALALVPAASPRRILPADPAAHAQAEKRLAIISPLLDFRNDRARFSVRSFSRLVAQISSESGVSRATLYNWLRRFQSDDLAGLADSGRSDKGVSRWATQSAANAELADLAAYAYLQEKLSKKMAYEIVVCRARQLEVEPPSYETIRVYLRRIPAAVKTLAIMGRRKYDEIFAPYIRRGHTDFEAGEILVSDHAIADVLVQNDLFDAKDRQHMRLRFTGLEDMRSRKFLAYAWSQEGSSRSINTCLRHAILRNGLFRCLYVDNGLDFQKVGKGARTSAWDVQDLPPEVLGLIARLGATIKYCQPFHPQAKLIESANRTYHQRLDRRFLTYTGPTPEQRPDRCIAALERHKKLLTQGRADESDLPLASEYIRAAILWIEEEYNNTPKNVPGMEGLTPNQAFEQFRWANRPPAPAPHILAGLLAERATRVIHECSIEMANRRYVGVDEWSQRGLHDREAPGKRVTVAFDPLDLDYLAAIDEDGKIFAYLHPEHFVRQADDEETRAAIGASMQERSHRYRETRGQLDALSRRVRSTGYVPQHEQMLQIGRLPIPIDHLIVHRPQPRFAPTLEPTNDLQPGELADRLTAALLRRDIDASGGDS
jgi:transposase-like protein